MENYQLLPGFSTADAEGINIFSDSNLVLSFTDWQENSIQIMFTDAICHRVGPFFDTMPRDDCAYEVIDSDWLNICKEAFQKFHGINLDEENEGYHHYKLGFHADEKVIDIIATGYTISSTRV